LLVLHVAAAVRLGRLRLGAGIQNVMAHVKQRSVLSSYTGLFGAPDDPTLDTLSNLDLNDPFTLSANAGASFEAGPFTFGLALQLPYTVSGDAKFQVRLGESVFLDPVVVEGDSARFELPFPLMVRAGVLWRATPDLKIELAANFENWSVQEELVVDPTGRIRLRNVPGIGDYQLGPLVIPRQMQDTWSFHLGSDFAVWEGLHLRGGGFYETAGFTDATTNVSQLDGTKLGLALGASYQLGNFRFDLAASRIFQVTRDVTNSDVRQLNPTNPEQALVVGNGRYEAGYWVGGIGIAWLLDV
jgi:long-subunit fatty acid transport protein